MQTILSVIFEVTGVETTPVEGTTFEIPEGLAKQ